MWDIITVDNTVNTFQNVQVYIHNSNITWGKYKYITFENTVNVFHSL